MIHEALLEMHYHRSMVGLFNETFGVEMLRILKPSPQDERWVGFDQGWVKVEEDARTFLGTLRQAVQKGEPFDKLYLGYFLQFKVVEILKKRNRRLPQGFPSPYFRIELSLSPIPTTGISQHDTLLRLCRIPNAFVYYACPMVFEDSELYREPDLSTLRLVNVASAPSGWATNERHYIAFRKRDDPAPYWLSEPTKTESATIDGVIRQTALRLLTPPELLNLISASQLALEAGTKKFDNTPFLHESFTVIEFVKREG